MDLKLELLAVPVTDVDRARDFYAHQVGFHVDFDQEMPDGIRFVQLTPPGSGCSIAIGRWGMPQSAPGSLQGLQLVAQDIEVARADFLARGLDIGEVQDLAWGRFLFFSDPDGNGWVVQQLVRR